MSYKLIYQDHEDCGYDRDCAKCKPKHSKPKKLLLECGQGTGSRTFTSSNDEPFQLAHVTLDTTCLKNPEMLIKFSSLVKMDALASGATVRLLYELFRVCGNEDPKSLGSWMYEEVGSALVVFESQEESFSFIFCECSNCQKCCDYFVTVMPLEIAEATATVCNGRIAAIAQSECDSSNNEHNEYDSNHCCIKSKSKHPKPKEVILECGQGNGSVVFRQATISQPPVEIAHVTLDTSCLSKPEVLIEFSSIISSAFRVRDVRLEFELFRICGDGEPLSRGKWKFERTNTVVPSAIDNAFTFVFCEKISCPGCCEYFVTVKGIELIVNDPGIYLGVAVNNARITAIAKSIKECNYFTDSKGDCIDCVAKSPKPKKILLECGFGTGRKTFTSVNDSSFQLAHTTVDTTCLCKPKINIEFSSLVSFEQLVDQGRAELRYELFRVCDNREPISLGVWIVGRIDFRIIDRSTNSFDFTFCDCISCPGCCDYFVTVTPIEITEGLIEVTVSNGRIAALAQEG